MTQTQIENFYSVLIREVSIFQWNGKFLSKGIQNFICFDKAADSEKFSLDIQK